MTNITSSCEEDEGEDFMDAHRFDVDDISELVQDNRFATQPTEYEDILRACGYGWFQRILLMFCGWAFISDSIEILVSLCKSFSYFFCIRLW